MDDSPAPKRADLGNSLRRLLDQRAEPRDEVESQAAVLNLGGHRHVVRIANLSATGAMILFKGDLAEGDEVVLHLLDHGAVTGQVRWLGDGRVGVSFIDFVGPQPDQ